MIFWNISKRWYVLNIAFEHISAIFEISWQPHFYFRDLNLNFHFLMKRTLLMSRYLVKAILTLGSHFCHLEGHRTKTVDSRVKICSYPLIKSWMKCAIWSSFSGNLFSDIAIITVKSVKTVQVELLDWEIILKYSLLI